MYPILLYFSYMDTLSMLSKPLLSNSYNYNNNNKHSYRHNNYRPNNSKLRWGLIFGF